MTNEQLMMLAIDEAKKGRLHTYTNPLVGAVIVKNGSIIGKGYHRQFGEDHAEVDALKSVADNRQLAAAKMYVTLEPCAHTGKTPPCCESIVASGIREVHIAQLDPNPLVAGKGKAYLEAHGVDVTVGIQSDEAVALNRMYNFYHRKGRPYVTLKYAMTLDGKINRTPGERSMITGKKSMMDVQQLRSEYQAILIGAETALVDDPQLTVRISKLPYPPIRIVIDRRGRLTSDLKLIRQADTPTWIFTEKAAHPAGMQGHVKVFVKENWTVEGVIETLAENGVQSVLIEGGAQIHQAFLNAGFLEQVTVYVAPKIFGGDALSAMSSKGFMGNEMHFQDMEIEKLGEDLKITVYSGRKSACSQESSKTSAISNL